MDPPERACAPTRSSKPHPRAPPPDPRLKPGPVFVTSGSSYKTPQHARGCEQLIIRGPTGLSSVRIQRAIVGLWDPSWSPDVTSRMGTTRRFASAWLLIVQHAKGMGEGVSLGHAIRSMQPRHGVNGDSG